MCLYHYYTKKIKIKLSKKPHKPTVLIVCNTSVKTDMKMRIYLLTK